MTDTIQTDTDVDTGESTRPVPATADVPLDSAPFTFRTLRAIVDTEFVPAGLRGNVNATLACILTGRELGLGPMESMRSIDIIDGKPSPSGEWMLSRVLDAGHIIYASEQTDRACTVVGKRREHGDVIAESSFTFTIEMAARAGLTNKSNWKKYPEAMLYWRAVSQLCRQMFPDVLHAIKYLPDELGDAEWHEPIPSSTGTVEVNGTTLPYDAPAADIMDAYGDDVDDTCPECGGRGGFMSVADNADIEMCDRCNGSGRIDDDEPVDAEIVDDDPTRPFE